MTVNYKHVVHLARKARSYYFVSACGTWINYPLLDGHPILSYTECDEEGIPRRVGNLKEVNCKACQRTFIYKQQLKQMIVPVLIGDKK